MATSVFSQIIMFFAVLFAINYFILLRKRPDKMNASFKMTLFSTVIFGAIVWVWGAA